MPWGAVSIKGEPVAQNPSEFVNLPNTNLTSTPSSNRQKIEELWAQNKKRQAEKLLNKWMDEESESPFPWVAAGNLRFLDRNYKKAISLYTAALKKSPDCGEAYYGRGQAQEALKNYLEAANEYQAALIAGQSYPSAQDALARVKSILDPQSSEAPSINNEPTRTP